MVSCVEIIIGTQLALGSKVLIQRAAGEVASNTELSAVHVICKNQHEIVLDEVLHIVDQHTIVTELGNADLVYEQNNRYADIIYIMSLQSTCS